MTTLATLAILEIPVQFGAQAAGRKKLHKWATKACAQTPLDGQRTCYDRLSRMYPGSTHHFNGSTFDSQIVFDLGYSAGFLLGLFGSIAGLVMGTLLGSRLANSFERRLATQQSEFVASDNDREKLRCSLVHYACRGDLPVVRYLIEELHIMDEQNEAFFAAASAKKPDVVAYLGKQKGGVTAADIRALTLSMDAPTLLATLQAVPMEKSQETIQGLRSQDWYNILRLGDVACLKAFLLRNTGAIAALNEPSYFEGMSPVEYAVKNCSLETIQLLRIHGGTVDAATLAPHLCLRPELKELKVDGTSASMEVPVSMAALPL